MTRLAPCLDDYLGPTGRLGIDLIAVRGDMEAIPGIQKFLIDCNWKFAVDNLFDWYHPQVTHMSAMASGIIPPNTEIEVDTGGAKNTQGDDLAIPAGLGGSGIDEMTFIAEYGHAIGGPSAKGLGDGGGLIDHSWRERPEVIEALSPIGAHGGRSPEHLPEQLDLGHQRSSRCASRARRARPRSGGTASPTATIRPSDGRST